MVGYRSVREHSGKRLEAFQGQQRCGWNLSSSMSCACKPTRLIMPLVSWDNVPSVAPRAPLGHPWKPSRTRLPHRRFPEAPAPPGSSYITGPHLEAFQVGLRRHALHQHLLRVVARAHVEHLRHIVEVVRCCLPRVLAFRRAAADAWHGAEQHDEQQACVGMRQFVLTRRLRVQPGHSCPIRIQHDEKCRMRVGGREGRGPAA